MPIHFRCPHCAKLLALGTRQGGMQIQCPLCARLLTVPRRTEVNVPTTTVMPPDRGQSWWTDAPPLPTTPADAWRPATNAPPTPPENAPAAVPLPAASVEHSLRECGSESRSDSATHFFTHAHLLILAGAVVIAIAIVGVVLVLLL